MAKDKSGSKRGVQFVLDKNGNPKVCAECKQKIRMVSAKKQLTAEQIAKRQARIDRMLRNLAEIKARS
jgi:hypothetical protein